MTSVSPERTSNCKYVTITGVAAHSPGGSAVGDVNPLAVEFDDVDEDIVDASAERDRLSQAVVSANDWTTETLLAQLDRQNIQMNPRFQRRDAWTVPRKSRYIESLILGLPVPQIVLAERKNARGRYIVLDGKQRLLALLQFKGRAEGKYNAFRLSGLEVLSGLQGKNCADLESDPLLSDLYNAFLNQSVRAVVIKNWPDLLFLHLVFLRLNTGSVKLSPQELRQAMFPGDFSDFVDDTARESHPMRTLLRLEEPDFRMRDVELLVRHLGFVNYISEYRGELKLFLDMTCSRLNDDWVNQGPIVRQQAAEFEAATQALIDIFGVDSVARRPTQEGRRPFNRALFDVLVYFLIDNDIRQRAVNVAANVQGALSTLWQDEPRFVRSVESTTKTIEATATRFSLWGNVLEPLVGVQLRIPRLEANRIVL